MTSTLQLAEVETEPAPHRPQPAAALDVAEEKLRTMKKVAERCKAALERQESLVTEAKRDVARLRRASAKAATPPLLTENAKPTSKTPKKKAPRA